MADESALKTLAKKFEERAKAMDEYEPSHWLLMGAKDVADALVLANEIINTASIPGTSKEPMRPIVLAHAIITAKLARKTS